MEPEGIDMFLPSAYDALWTVLLVVGLAGLVVAALVVVVVVRLIRSSSGLPPRRGVLEQRLEHLDRLHTAGRITDAEHGEARARVLGTI
jgi:hypothetical protein